MRCDVYMIGVDDGLGVHPIWCFGTKVWMQWWGCVGARIGAKMGMEVGVAASIEAGVAVSAGVGALTGVGVWIFL